MKKQQLSQTLYRVFIKPNVRIEDDRRGAYILNVLLCGTIILSFLAFVSAALSQITRGTQYNTMPLVAMAAITSFFMTLLYLSKRGYYRYAAVVYIAVFFLVTTYPIARWGIVLPQGILTYCLIIVIAGVLLSARAALAMSVVATVTLLSIEWLHASGQLTFDTAWMQTTGGYNDIMVYAVTFCIVTLISWLSNRELQQSLDRTRQSEKALRLERNLLEARVAERTKELEQAQVEQLEELNRFAEFGRISSTLLHELTNPLTSAMLNLELIKNKRTSKLYDQLHESITYMEEYVSSARRQLRRESERGEFNIAQEINRVVGFLQPKAKAMRVDINTVLDGKLILFGDGVKFNQIISNLLANAIDAYEPLLAAASQPIQVTSRAHSKHVFITITDFGIGIPRKDLPQVFEAFYTTKMLDRGTGLGLTITKRTIEEDFGGTISVKSSKRSGTCFTLRIPFNENFTSRK